jgi:hypothetical protein
MIMLFRMRLCFLIAGSIWCVACNHAGAGRVVALVPQSENPKMDLILVPAGEVRQAEAAFSRNQEIEIWMEIFRPILTARQQESLDQLEERIRRRHFSKVASE